MLVIVTDAENGLSESMGSEIVAVNRGNSASTAVINPSIVATYPTIARRDVFGCSSFAFWLSFFGLGSFFKLFCI